MRTRFAGMAIEAEKGYAWKLIWKFRCIHMYLQSLSCEKPFVNSTCGQETYVMLLTKQAYQGSDSTRRLFDLAKILLPTF